MTLTKTEIQARVAQVLASIPNHVRVVAAAKGRTAVEVQAALEAGIHAVGHNYVQEAQAMQSILPEGVEYHFIGHLQRNKARHAVKLFQVVETLDSARLAKELDKRAREVERVLPVLIEVNIAREEAKAGVLPEQLGALADALAGLPNLALRGLMTMGPAVEDPEQSRPYFSAARELFDGLRAEGFSGISSLSMGMSDSYPVAIEEGANLIRLGTALFGPRPG
jgi:pyridoxal phosphate enzyme (YggS family)